MDESTCNWGDGGGSGAREELTEEIINSDFIDGENIVCYSSVVSDNSVVQLPIVRCPLGDRRKLLANIMLDTGSTINFITTKVSGQLKISSSSYKVLNMGVVVYVQGLHGEKPMTVNRVSFKLGAPCEETIEALEVMHIMDFPELTIPKSVKGKFKLDGTYPREAGTIDILLGVVDTFKVMNGEPQPVGEDICMVPTVYGYVPSGRFQDMEEGVRHEEHTFLSAAEELNKTVSKMWTMDLLPMDDTPSTLTREEALAISKIDEVLVHDPIEKRFETGLLWKEDPDFVNNYPSVKARFDSLLKKLRADPQLCQAYIIAINEFIDMGFVELIEDPRCDDLLRKDLYYLPHRAVVDFLRLSTKCRIVFDGSAKMSNHESLNSQLLAGPPLQVAIMAIEARFRVNKYILVGDITKMFLQIHMRDEDRDYLRFLWKDPKDPGKPKVYRFTRLAFGTKDAPFIAISSIKALIRMKQRDPEITDLERKVCEVLDRDMYVDDLTIVSNTIKEALDLYHGVQRLLSEGGFSVRKWATNSPELLKYLDDKTLAPTEFEIHGGDFAMYSSDTSTLGVLWKPKEDVIHFSKCSNDAELNKNTMRSVAQLLARPFDPLGILSPFILGARFVLKECFKLKMKWDDPLEGELLSSWENWVVQLEELNSLEFTRYCTFGEETLIVIFSDASLEGYGCCAYCYTYDNEKREWYSHLLAARSRVAPLNKNLTLPQLELSACFIAAELGQFLKQELQLETKQFRFFTDSMICLYWLVKDVNILSPFVANRVDKIQKYGFTFAHVRTNDNPADLTSRSCNVEVLTGAFWQHGPKWLCEPIDHWPKQKIDFSQVDKKEGLKKKHVLSFNITCELTTPSLHIPNVPRKVKGKKEKIPPTLEEMLFSGTDKRFLLHEFYSDYKTLIKRTAWLYAAIRILKEKISVKRAKERDSADPQEIRPLAVKEDFDKALIYWLKIAQASEFSNEIECLKRNKEILTSSKLIALAPYLNEDGLLCVGGRIGYSELTDEMKHPIILPKRHFFSKMIAWHIHKENLHSGLEQTHYKIREKYYIFRARQLLKSILRFCVKCKRISSRPIDPIMSELPRDRVCLSRNEPPFTYVGVDLTGEIKIRKDDTENFRKAYIVLYTCLTTRAVFCDVIFSNKTEEFLMSFKRFIAIEGRPLRVRSDSAEYFHRARKELGEYFSALSGAMDIAAKEYEFTWIHNCSLASFEGGVFERMIRTVKVALIKMCRHSFLTHQEFMTLLRECQALVNDRPLISGASSDTFEVITPSLLTRGRLLRTVPISFEDSPLQQKRGVRERWENRRKAYDRFVRIWMKEYLPMLQERHKWSTRKPNLKVGDLVVLNEGKLKRGCWPIGRIVSVEMGRNDSIRHIEVAIPKWKENGDPDAPNVLQRSVRQVCPLELAGVGEMNKE